MNFDRINQLLRSNTTVKLITADNAALIISFLFKSFKNNPNNICESRVENRANKSGSDSAEHIK